MWRATKLDGLNVFNNSNEKIGDINELILDHSGKVIAVVIGVGGFLGMGERYVAMPYDQFRWSSEPVRSVMSSPPASSSSSPGGTTDRGNVSEAYPSELGDATTRGYPDHALLNMTKDQLQAAPEFRFGVATASTSR